MKKIISVILIFLMVFSMGAVPAFALSYPNAYHADKTLEGIDVSEHQGVIDWEKVKADGVDFAIIRCGYGMDQKSQDDDYFLRNAQECERLGIPYGVYLYSYATNPSRAASEAEHTLRLLEGRTLSYPVFYDMEDASTLVAGDYSSIQANLAAMATTYCDKITAAGYPVGIYANLNWWNNWLTASCFNTKGWYKWVAQFNKKCEYTGTYTIWQHTSSGSVNGINGRVDMNFQIGYPKDHGTNVVRPPLTTNKTNYTYGDEIRVSTNCDNANAWVGLYKSDETPGEATPSLYWYNVAEKSNPFNILDGTENRKDDYTVGSYKVILFGDGGYTNILSTVNITVTKEVSKVETKASTCTVEGSVTTYYTDGTKDVEVLPLAKHEFNDLTVEPKCEEQGYIYRVCEVCSHSETEWLDAQHKEVSHEGKAATCTEAGWEAYVTCENCEYSTYTEIPAGHDWTGEWKTTKEATCKEAGVKTKTCKNNCGQTQTESVPKLTTHGKEEILPAKAPTATETGLTEGKRCTVCGTVTAAQSEVPALGEEDNDDVPAKEGIDRLYGSNRYETAFKAADELKALRGGKQFDNVIVACGTNFADALAGSYLAAVKDAPILLVQPNMVNKVTNYIKTNLKAGGTVYILGGTNAVPANMEAGLGGFTVKRFAGSNRYETNLLILKEAGVGDQEILVATGTNFADSLSASATGKPILLVGAKLTSAQKQFLAGTKGTKYILGGTNAVSANIENELKAYGAVKRLGGANRYATSVLIAETFFSAPKSAVLSYAQNFPDGLCGGVIAYKQGAPMLLVTDSGAKAADTYAAKCGIKNGYVLGGTGLISDATMNMIFG